jgi:pseudaminic acid synthase
MYNNFFKKKPLFIAEISANHNGSIKLAKKLIWTAKQNGADAVKLQTYSPNTITINSKRTEFKIKKGLWRGNYLWDLYKKAQTPFSWHKELFNYAKKIKIICFSSPFDETAVDLLEKLNCPFYKLASAEITHLPLIKKIALTKKPLIISTGMASLEEVDKAIKYAKKFGTKKIILLYCVSNYPSKISDFNFKNIEILKKKFKCRVGFSDHSTNNLVAAIAVSSGADIVEKHIALKGQRKAPDIAFSAKGDEIKTYANILRQVYLMLGSNNKYKVKSDKKNIIFRRSIYSIKDIKKGERFTEQNIKIVRPNKGLDPSWYFRILNKKSKFSYKKYTPINKKVLNKLR